MRSALLSLVATAAATAPHAVPAAAAVTAPPAAPPPARAPWTHDWASVAGMLWGDWGHPYISDANFTASDLAFVGRSLAIVSLEKCLGLGNVSSTEQAFVAIAAALKAANPAVRVLFYYSAGADITPCYAASANFTANASWWLRDDAGVPYVMSAQQPWYYHDPTVPEAVAWWSQVPLSLPDAAFERGLVDGVFADGIIFGAPFANTTADRNVALEAAYAAMGNATSSALNAASPPPSYRRQVIGNGIALYGYPPDHGVSSLPYLDGVCFEHFASFELIGANGSLVPALMAELIGLVQIAAVAEQTVLIKSWPGPVVTPITSLGPSWPGGTQPRDRAGLGEAAAAMMNGSLAMFLLVVEPNVWLSYSWWYDVLDGYFPCPDQPQRCSAPVGWYPQWQLPLGAPTGPATRLGPGVGSGWVYTRSFASATVTVDLVDPWGTAGAHASALRGAVIEWL